MPFEELGCRCVFSSEWDIEAKRTYAANFEDCPAGDITKIDEKSIPDHEILVAGFPCQAFSIIGNMNGFKDARGTLFFEIERILREKRPKSFLLENVKMLVGHKKGETFRLILESLYRLGYFVHWKVLNALDFGLPHKRERVFIVGFSKNYAFEFPVGNANGSASLSDILEKNVPKKYYVSRTILEKRKSMHMPKVTPSIWHENKGGNVSSYPYSCALRANASYNYLLVNGERRLTPRESLRLLGFPDTFKIVSNDHHMRRLTGNSVCVPVVRAIAEKILDCLENRAPINSINLTENNRQLALSSVYLPTSI